MKLISFKCKYVAEMKQAQPSSVALNVVVDGKKSERGNVLGLQ